MYKFDGTADDLNYIFNKVCTVPDIACIALDVHNIDRVNPAVVTRDNIWHVLVMLALTTENSGAHLLYKCDVTHLPPTGYTGAPVLEAIKKCVKVVSDTPEPDNIKRAIWEIENG